MRILDLLDKLKDITQINGNSANSNFEYLTHVISVAIQVFGKVQGVWFRASVKKEADKQNVKGTVKNLPDGSVLIIAIGENNDIKKLEKWCNNGPEFAKVEKVKVTKIDYQQFKDFKIIRS